MILTVPRIVLITLPDLNGLKATASMTRQIVRGEIPSSVTKAASLTPVIRAWNPIQMIKDTKWGYLSRDLMMTNR